MFHPHCFRAGVLRRLYQAGLEFVNDDPEIAYHVVATLDSEPRVLEGGAQRAYTIRYSVDCFGGDDGCVTGDPFRIRALTMSSDLAFGTWVHDLDTVESGSETFDPPIVLTGASGSVGDVWESDPGGAWASTITSLGACDLPYTADWDSCLTLELDGQPAHPLHGAWTAAPGYNLVVFQWRDDPQPWRLLTQSWTPPD